MGNAELIVTLVITELALQGEGEEVNTALILRCHTCVWRISQSDSDPKGLSIKSQRIFNKIQQKSIRKTLAEKIFRKKLT